MEQNENQDSIRERIRAYAFDLKLPLVRRDIDLLIQQGLDERWNLWMFTAELLRQEKENRSENQRRHRIKNAAFPQLRYLNEIDTDALPPEARKALPNLETLDFIKEGRNLILYGNPGTGKTHLATALGIAACNAGYSVLFTSVPRLLTQIRECRNAMTLRALENKFERYDMSSATSSDTFLVTRRERRCCSTICHSELTRKQPSLQQISHSTDGTRLLQTKY